MDRVKANSLNTLVTVLIWLMAIAFVATLGLYFYNFWGKLSTKPADWGSFGSLLGGIGILFISFLNIKIWLKQTEVTRQSMQEQTQKTLEAMKQQYLKQLQLDFIRKELRDLYAITRFSSDRKRCFEMLTNSRDVLSNIMVDRYKYIIPENKELVQKAWEAIVEVGPIYLDYLNTHKGDISYKDFPVDEVLAKAKPIRKLVHFYQQHFADAFPNQTTTN